MLTLALVVFAVGAVWLLWDSIWWLAGGGALYAVAMCAIVGPHEAIKPMGISIALLAFHEACERIRW
jgi:hypothetical protein